MNNEDIKGIISPLILREQPTKMWALIIYNRTMVLQKNMILF